MRLIDADAFSAFIKKTVHEHGYDGDGALRICDALTVGDVLNSVCAELDGTALEGFKNAPTVDAVPVRRGKWKAVTEDGEDYKRICSYCGKEAPFDETERVYLIYPHCPWCGADMREEDGDG